MSLSIANLKLEFMQNLIKRGIDIGLEQDESIFDSQVFSYSNEFKEFVEEKYNIDIDKMSLDFEELLELNFNDGQFVLPEKEDEKVSQEELMVTILNTLMDDKNFVANVDKTKDGVVDKKEMEEFLAFSNLKDGETSRLTFNDLVQGVIEASKGEFKSTEEIETPKTETQRTSKTHSNGGGGNYSPPKIETEEEIKKNPYEGENVSTLERKEQTEQSNYDTAKSEYLSACNGSHEKLADSEQSVDDAQSSFIDAIKEQNETLGSQLDEILTQTRELEKEEFATKEELTITEQEITVQGQIISDSNARISNLNNLKTNLKASLSSIETAQTDVISSINAQIAEIDTQIAEETKKIEEAETKKKELETQKTDLNEALTTIKDSSTDVQSQYSEISGEVNKLLENAGISALYEAYNSAKANHETLRNELATACKNNMETAQTNLENIRKELVVAHNREDKKSFSIDEFDIAGTGYMWKDMSVARDSDLDGDGIKVGKDTKLQYGAIMPKNVNPDEELPVLVFLCGSGEDSDYEAMQDKVYKEIFENYGETGLETWKGHILCVNYNNMDGITLSGCLDEIIDDFSKEYKINTDKISIAGYSLGASKTTYMGATPSKYDSSKTYLTDDVGYKYRNAVLIAGGQTTTGNYDLPTAVFSDIHTSLSNSTLNRYIREKLDLSENGDDYWTDTGVSHEQVDNLAFTLDLNNNGKADIFEFIEGTLK